MTRITYAIPSLVFGKYEKKASHPSPPPYFPLFYKKTIKMSRLAAIVNQQDNTD